jgi:ribonuclease HI
MPMKPKKLLVYSDGASQGNPGRAAIGAVIKDERGKVVSRISRAIGHATNNQAEYRAIIAALEAAVALGAEEVEARADSELVVEQLNGRYKVKKASLRSLYQEVVRLTGALKTFSISYIPRERNKEADRLANKALAAKGD